MADYNNLYCLCEKGIFGKYCSFNKTLYMKTLKRRYKIRCINGISKMENSKIICICISQFYVGQSCQINCKYICHYGECELNKGKILCNCSHNFLGFFCYKNVYNIKNIMLKLVIVAVFIIFMIILILVGVRLSRKKLNKFVS
ncbi:hypothetical protein HZS_4654 [Henneguya salminicola]|nr:hypothetical protein HZS_4654 [Henneguya salminicola]